MSPYEYTIVATKPQTFLQLDNFKLYENVYIRMGCWYLILPVVFDWKLNQELLKKINFKNWELSKIGKVMKKDMLYST